MKLVFNRKPTSFLPIKKEVGFQLHTTWEVVVMVYRVAWGGWCSLEEEK